MKKVGFEKKGENTTVVRVARRAPPSAPSPPLLPSSRKSVVADSVTRREIAKYWKLRRKVEEDHFTFAIKAAARLRARNLSEDDYKVFVEALSDDDDIYIQEELEKCTNIDPDKKDIIRLGIKNWWTKSKYAYLNQPDIKAMDGPKCRHRGSSYAPQLCYMSAPPLAGIFGVC